jgi:flagella basal body P-ring formation protein FlgA
MSRSGQLAIFVPVRAGENAPSAIARGESVTIAVVGDGFAVSQPGEALDAGAVGD